MAIKQEILCTFLPKGLVDERNGRLSVLLTPRLENDDVLSSFVFNEWPFQAQELEFHVNFHEEATAVATLESEPSLRADLWEALFPGDTYVRSYTIEEPNHVLIDSYPAGNVADFTKDAYAKVALSDGAVAAKKLVEPGAGFFAAVAPPATIPGVGERGGIGDEALLDKLKDEIKKADPSKNLNLKALPSKERDAGLDVYRGVHFYDRTGHERLVDLAPPGPHDDKPDGVDPRVDFHQMVGMLGHHPELERLLGIVFDLVVEFPSDLDLTQTMHVWVEPQWLNGETVPFASPRTVTKLNTFRAASKAKPQNPNPSTPKREEISKGGLLNLRNIFGDGRKVFQLTQQDPDAEAFKVKRFGEGVIKELQRAARTDTKVDPEISLLPSLRSPGLTLSRAGFATYLKARVDRNSQLIHVTDDHVLYADDLVRGYAIDIYDETVDRWFSLTAREGTAVFTRSAETPGDDIVVDLSKEDGWIGLSPTKAPRGAIPGKKNLQAHESLFLWANWSLAATRPGKTLNQHEQPEKVTNKAETEFKLEVEYEVPTTPEGVLPILRYGRSYRVRARIVDLAGNSARFGEPTSKSSFPYAIGPRVFDRLEPALPPVLLMRHLQTVGESLERIVIRSKGGGLADEAVPNHRHVAPPKIDYFTAELHGMFDTPTGLDPNAHSMIAARENGSFGAKNDQGNYIHADAKPDPGNHDQPYYDRDNLTFDVENESSAPLPYLPDPLAKGAAFVNLPATPASEIPLKATFKDGLQWPADWPEATPFLMTVEEGEENGHELIPGRLLTIFLPKGEVVEVDYSSYHEPDDITNLGLMRWVAEAAENPDTDGEVDEDEAKRRRLKGWMRNESRRFKGSRRDGRDELPTLELMRRVARDSQNPRFWEQAGEELKHLARIVGGTHAMAMPSRKLFFVHAVRQPLIPPVLQGLKPDQRPLGATDAILRATPVYDRKSTVEIDMRATWTDVFDELNPGLYPTGRKEIPVESFVFKYKIPAPGESPPKAFQTRQQFNDTKYRLVTYRATALTRFTEYFKDRDTVVFGNSPYDQTRQLSPNPDLLGNQAVIPGSETVKNPENGVTHTRGVHYSMDYEAATITRLSGAIIADVDIIVEYLSPPITQDTVSGVEIPILNTARPAAPKVPYVVPTFGWERDDGPDYLVSKRTGRGLRVYLNRPWWSSGDGEQLGVLLHQQIQVGDSPSKAAKPFVTQWGLDPLWKSAPTTDIPKQSDFPLRKSSSRSNLTLEEVPGEKFGVAGHEVVFDQERGLWYSDIVLNTEAYFPFVRLALARFQPNSEDGAHLSRAVVVDFIQLTPDRNLQISRNAEEQTAKVELRGRTYSKRRSDSGALTNGPSLVGVTVEGRRPEVSDPKEELGWYTVKSEVMLQGTVGSSGGDGRGYWSGEIPLPAIVPGEPIRLVIREYELIAYQGEGFTGSQKRLVYADTVILPDSVIEPADLIISETTINGFTVKNRGGADSGPFKAQVKNADGVVLSNHPYPLGLAPGEFDTVPIGPAGHARTVFLDTDEQVAEYDEDNNSAPIPIAPELTVTATKSNFTIKNTGGDAPPFTAELRTAQGAFIKSWRFPVGLEAGRTSTKTVGASKSPRKVFVDTLNEVDELNEVDNSAVIPRDVSAKPDLQVRATKTRFTITNEGIADAGPFVARVTGGGGAPFPDETFNFSGLKAGGAVGKGVDPRSRDRTVTVDSKNKVAESDESNNTATIPKS